jgi:hypothetical protein
VPRSAARVITIKNILAAVAIALAATRSSSAPATHPCSASVAMRVAGLWRGF